MLHLLLYSAVQIEKHVTRRLLILWVFAKRYESGVKGVPKVPAPKMADSAELHDGNGTENILPICLH